MKLSESLRRNIMEATVGGIVNRFKARSRRDVLFFEDILANYIKACESAGHEKEMFDIGREFSELVIAVLAPSIIRKLPLTVLLNRIAKKVWINLGMVDEMTVKKENDFIAIKTKNEHITRFIGKNIFAVGMFTGIINAFSERASKCISKKQTKECSLYTCFIGKKQWISPQSNKKEQYYRLNSLKSVSGFTLKDAMKKKIFYLEKNRLCFRGKNLIPLENTLFHLISNRGIILDRVPHLSYDFFRNTINKKGDRERLLELLKNLLQVLGWGIVNILKEDNSIELIIRNPPHGLQKEEDNWDFIINFILGYLWLLDKKLGIESKKISNNSIRVTYS